MKRSHADEHVLYRTKQAAGTSEAPEFSFSKHALRRWGLRARTHQPNMEGARLVGRMVNGALVYFLPKPLCWALVRGWTVVTVLQKRPRALQAVETAAGERQP